MRAYLLTAHGDQDQLQFTEDHPQPKPAPGQALLRVLACGLNNTDINTRIGWYAPEDGDEDGGWSGALSFPRIQGADLCAEVVEVNASDSIAAALTGKRVLADPWLRDWKAPHDLNRCGYLGSECDGGFAEYCVLPIEQIHPINSPLSAPELATFATSGITALNMLSKVSLQPGETVLVPGASGGVGGYLVQLVKAAGGRAVALSTEAKADAVRALGAEAVLPREVDDLRAALKAATGETEVAVVADPVGGPLWPQMLGLLSRGGRYVCSGAVAGSHVPFDLRVMYLRDLSLFGATITAPDLFADLVKKIEQGIISPTLSKTWPLHELPAAQRAFLSKEYPGKLAVVVS